MSNFVEDNTDLPFPKSDLVPLPVGANVNQYSRATDWNTACQALVDVKGWLRGGKWIGITPQGSDPAPAGVTDYLWVNASGRVVATNNEMAKLSEVIPGTRTVSAGTGLVGGGALSSNISLAVDSSLLNAVATSVANSRQVLSGFGLTGGGDLTANRTFRVDPVAVSFVSVKDPTYAAVGDGVADDRTPIANAIAAAVAGGTATGGIEVVLPPGTYRLSKYLPIIGVRNLKIRGSAFTTIKYASDDLSVVYDSTAVTYAYARSGFLFKNCQNITIEGVHFEGADTQDLGVNVGHGVYATRVNNIRLEHCTARGGASLFAQDSFENTSGTSGSSLSVSGTTVTLTNDGDPNHAFHGGMVGCTVQIVAATSSVNNGIFRITSVLSATQLTYENPSGANDPGSPLVWVVQDGDDSATLVDCIMHVRGTSFTGSGGTYERCQFIRPDTRDQTGIPDEFQVSGTTVTLYDATASWTPAVKGSYIKIEGATSGGNNGIFKILSATSKTRFAPATLTYTNASAVAELAPMQLCTWWIAGGERQARGAGASAISSTVGVVTFTSDTAIFKSDDVGKVLRITDATTPAYNGPKLISRYISATQVQYLQTGVTTEAYGNVFSIDSHDDTKTDAYVGANIESTSTSVAANQLADTTQTMIVNAYAGKLLTDSANRQWRIVSNTATVFTLAGTGTPAAGAYTAAGGFTHGSSHGIYYFAGRRNIKIIGCTFRNVRTIGVKISGSSLPIDGVEIAHCTFDECGSAIIAGADDAQTHANFNFHHNRLINCGLGRLGWTYQWGIAVFGANNVSICDNQFLATHDVIAAHLDGGAIGGYYGIFAGRYLAGITQPLEDATILRNKFSIDASSVNPTRVASAAIHCERIGQRTKWRTGGTLTRFSAGAQSFTISTASTGSMTRPSGSFVADGTRPGMVVTMSGFSNGGNNVSKTIASVTASTLTFTSNAGLVNETSASGNYTSPLMTLTDATACFSWDNVGDSLTFYGAPDAGNNNTIALETKMTDFTVMSVTGTGTLTFINANGVGGGVAAGTYRIKPKPASGGRRSGPTHIAHNEILGYGTTGIDMIGCSSPQVAFNIFNGIAAPITDEGSASPHIHHNTEIGASSTGARIKLSTSTSWPIVHDNHTSNGAIQGGNLLSEGPAGRTDMGVGVNNNTAIDHPLLGKRGRCRVTRGCAEAVFAFGSELVNGDTIGVNGTVFIYDTTSLNDGSGVTFSTQAGFIAQIGSGFTAEDYGTGLSGTPTTGHLRVRLSNPAASPDHGYIDTINVLNDTALVIPRNDTGGGESILYTRGEGVSYDSGALALNIVAGAGTITRASGSWLTDGLRVNGTITLTGFTNAGNNSLRVIQSVSATVITVTDNTFLVDETGGGDEHVLSALPRRLVVWSLGASRQAPFIQPDNAAAAALMATGWYPEKASKNAGSNMPFRFLGTSDGTEEFSWMTP